MYLNKYKTSIQTEKEANLIINFLSIFYVAAVINFDLLHPDKILLIESQADEDHSDRVIELIESRGFKCERINNITQNITFQ